MFSGEQSPFMAEVQPPVPLGCEVLMHGEVMATRSLCVLTYTKYRWCIQVEEKTNSFLTTTRTLRCISITFYRAANCKSKSYSLKES